MQLNDSSTASDERGLGVGLRKRRVGHDQREHRRHVRADHRGALGHAGDA